MTDRYNPDPLDDNAAFADWKRSVEQRLSSLEGGPITGTIRVRGPGGDFDVFHVDENGMDAPQFPLPQNFVTTAAAAVSVVGTTYALVSRTILPVLVSHAAVRVIAGWSFSNFATTGQFRMRSKIAVPSATDTVVAETTSGVFSFGTAGTATLAWLHQLPLGEDAATFAYIDLEARTVSGAGAIQCYEPSVVMVSPSHGATALGVWGTILN